MKKYNHNYKIIIAKKNSFFCKIDLLENYIFLGSFHREKRVSLEIKKKNLSENFWSKSGCKSAFIKQTRKKELILKISYGTIHGAIWSRTMGGPIFRRYRDHSRINSVRDVGKHCSLPCGWKLQSNYRVKVGNSIFDEGQETIRAICGT